MLERLAKQSWRKIFQYRGLLVLAVLVLFSEAYLLRPFRTKAPNSPPAVSAPPASRSTTGNVVPVPPNPNIAAPQSPASANVLSYLEYIANTRRVYVPKSKPMSPPPPLDVLSPPPLGTAPVVRVSGYLERESVAPDSVLKIKLATLDKQSGSTTVQSVKFVDATSNRGVESIALPAPVPVPAAPCASHKAAGCAFPTQIDVSTSGILPGVYYLLIESDARPVSDPIFFIIRPEPRAAGAKRVAVMFPTFTWQAYNAAGGASFYKNTPTDQLLEVSLHRPVNTSLSADYHNARSTVPFVRELVSMGIEPLLITNQDMHDSPGFMAAIDVLIITGHDEYWTGPMRDNLDGFLRRGGRLAIFSGNTAWWKMNVANGAMYLNQNPDRDSNRPNFEATGYWFRRWIDRSMVDVIGLTFRVGGVPLYANSSLDEALRRGVTKADYRASGKMRVADQAHPIFSGTGLAKGEWFGGDAPLVSIEMDSVLLRGDGEIDNTTETKFPASMKVLATGFVIDPSAGSSDGHWANRILHSGLVAELTPDIGGRVIHFGSIGWFGPLDAGDPNVRRIVQNTIRYLVEH